jgi:hypothetical protein
MEYNLRVINSVRFEHRLRARGDDCRPTNYLKFFSGIYSDHPNVADPKFQPCIDFGDKYSWRSK